MIFLYSREHMGRGTSRRRNSTSSARSQVLAMVSMVARMYVVCIWSVAAYGLNLEGTLSFKVSPAPSTGGRLDPPLKKSGSGRELGKISSPFFQLTACTCLEAISRRFFPSCLQ
jgi:hypothetical protein